MHDSTDYCVLITNIYLGLSLLGRKGALEITKIYCEISIESNREKEQATIDAFIFIYMRYSQTLRARYAHT